MLDWVIYSLVGKLLIFIVQSLPRPEKIGNHWFFGKLLSCDLCLGVWIYGFMSLVLRIDLLSAEFGLPYIPLFGELATACMTSFIMHLISLGWKAKFNVIIV